MNRLRLAIVIFILLTALAAGAACSRTANRQEIKANGDEIVIALNLEGITEDIYRVDLEYYLDDDLMGGMATGHADETPYREDAVFRLTPTEFPEGANMDSFSFHVVVSFEKGGVDVFSSAGKVLSTNVCDAFRAEYGNVYRFRVAGSFADGLKLTAANTREMEEK